MEEWRDVKGYEGLYKVSNLGRVKSLERKAKTGYGSYRIVKGMILKQNKDNRGYLKIVLYKDGKKKTHRIHKLVAIAFLNHKPNGFNGLIVDHIDNNPLNNRLDNLQVISQRLNTSKDKKGGSSKYVGVSWYKPSKKWRAQVKINGKKEYLGSFKCELSAAYAYNKALKEATR